MIGSSNSVNSSSYAMQGIPLHYNLHIFSRVINFSEKFIQMVYNELISYNILFDIFYLIQKKDNE